MNRLSLTLVASTLLLSSGCQLLNKQTKAEASNRSWSDAPIQPTNAPAAPTYDLNAYTLVQYTGSVDQLLPVIFGLNDKLNSQSIVYVKGPDQTWVQLTADLPVGEKSYHHDTYGHQIYFRNVAYYAYCVYILNSK